MIEFNTISKIKNDAVKSIKKGSDGKELTDKKSKNYFTFWFRVIPVLIASFSWFHNIKLVTFESYITTGVSIFTGLFFSLLLGISTKIRTEKENENIDIYNYKAIKENLYQISNITLYIVSLGIQIMLFILLSHILNFNCDKLQYTYTSIILYLLARYFFCIICILQRFYYVQRDEIDNIM